jgi:hypothetical protein
MLFNMAVFHSFRLLYNHQFKRHHIVYGIIGAVFIFFSPLYGQEIFPSLNAYRTNLGAGAVGDWDDPTTWEVWNGMLWSPASSPPDRNNDVFIEKGNEVRLRRTEEVNNLYLFADTVAGKKINLQVNDLDVYGALRCFTKSGETYAIYSSTSLTEDWIYPETGNIVLKGATRTVVDRSSWSGGNGQSRFGVVFNPDPGETLTVNAVFKASSFVVKTGTVYQTVNLEGTPATSTFSFNIQDKISTSAYGDFIIEPGATLISEATDSFGELIFRTTNRPASNFHLKEGGTFILLGQEPIVEAVNIQLEGNVYYSGNSGTQEFISGSMTGVTAPSTYNHLFFEGAAVKQPPDFLELKGDFIFLGGGEVNTADTAIDFTGSADQEVKNITLDLKEVEIDKPSGSLSFDGNLIVNDRFTMVDGLVDFRGNQLYINGDYGYASGTWENLSRLVYQNLPSALTPSNSTFPFVDAYLGGVRSIILSGTLSSVINDLNIAYHQLPAINWDPGFNDGGVPIVYALNSYFSFNLAGFTATDNLEIHISADNLIVVDDGHLRIIGIGDAAPGSHLPALDGLGGRAMTLAELNGQNITLGSTGVASILPVTWLSYQAEELPYGNLISWSTAKEEDNKEFVILKSNDAINFENIGHVPGKGYSNEVHQYQFLDKSINLSRKIYYQIKQLDFNGSHESSPVFQLTLKKVKDILQIFPNPFYDNHHHLLTISIPEEMTSQPAHVRVKNASGILVTGEVGTIDTIITKLVQQIRMLPAGIYIILVETDGEWQAVKWIKKN